MPEVQWRATGGIVVRILLLMVLGNLVIRVGSAVINRVIAARKPGAPGLPRVRTMAALLRSVLKYAVDFVVLVSVLELVDIKTSSVLAGAGIVGLAVGFGAQNLVKDVIAGFFILLEDQFAVGDYVTIAGITGTVEEVGLRSTRVRGLGGETHVIPNGIIDRSANMSRGSTLAVVDVPVSADEQIGRVSQVLKDAIAGIGRSESAIKEGPELLGPVALSEKGVTLRITARTEALQHWAVERRIRTVVKEAFEHEGIRFPMPFPVSKE
ncbi:MAG: mechanosensitive ion channel [Bacillota bacterium]|nr:mechanosensitive ion channel [Bacillota bacterium]